MARLADAPHDAGAGRRPRFTRRSTAAGAARRRFASRTTRRAWSNGTARASSSSRRRSTAITGIASRASSAGATARTSRVSRRAAPTPRELLLPVSYVFETRSFRLKGYSVLVGERPGPARRRRLERDLRLLPQHGAVFRRAVGRAGRAGRARLPGRGRRSAAAARAALAAARSTGAARRRCATPWPRRWPRSGARRRAAATIGAPRSGHGIRELRSHFGARNFVEVGIGCEACHGGSREHVADPRVHPDFAPRSPFLAARPEAGGDITRAEQVNRVCARCHQVLFSRYPFTWEGERGAGPASRAAARSRRARRATSCSGGCARQMSCATCHDPHAEDRRADLDRLATAAGNAVCVALPPQYAPRAALRAHAHHDPAGAGGELHRLPHAEEEHGPRLRADPLPPHRLARTIRRASSAIARSSARCATPTRRVAELVDDDGGAGGGSEYDRAALADLYGALDARPLAATLVRGKAHEQAVAVAVLGEARRTEALPGIARQLANPFPLVRYYARRARRRAGAAPVSGRPRSPDGGDHRGGARLRAGGVPRSRCRRRCRTNDVPAAMRAMKTDERRNRESRRWCC